VIVFSILFVLVAVTLITTTVINGFEVLNLHLACYGLILLCIGYLIDLSRKQKVEDIRGQIEWIMDKKYGSLAEDIKSLRTLVLSVEDRRTKTDDKKNGVKPIETTRRRLEIELDKLPKDLVSKE
jgi:hypothetical protein